MTSRQEYLKKYLSSDVQNEKKAKKKRLKKKPVETRFRIIEDDVNVPFSAANAEVEKTDEFEDEEDEIKPVVALVNNETDELKLLGKFQTSNWQSVSEKGGATSGDASPPRRSRDDSGNNQSPRRRHDSDNDQSPPRRRRHDSGNDQSPPRRSRHDSNNDSSPPRRRHDSNNDQSPPRRRRHDSGNDQSPPRRRRHDSGSDTSPPRRQRRESPPKDSPPNRRQQSRAVVAPEAIRRNIRSKKKEPTEEQKQRAEEMAKKYAVWNKGQKQVQDREEKLAELAAEASKPFARHKGDEDLEDHLKNIEYNDDPMLEYMREKKQKETGKVSRPAFKGPWPPNRYSIPPGYRWDGVDRSNGFEVKLLSVKNVKKAEEEEFYKWTSGTFE